MSHLYFVRAAVARVLIWPVPKAVPSQETLTFLSPTESVSSFHSGVSIAGITPNEDKGMHEKELAVL